jgi:hypothetical protein
LYDIESFSLDFKAFHFWQWTDFQSYVEFLACFSTLCAGLLFAFGTSSAFVEAIGFLAVFTEGKVCFILDTSADLCCFRRRISFVGILININYLMFLVAAMLGAPQFYRNLRSGSTAGMR